MAGLYLHIPFCKQACHYCDFHFSTNQDHRSDLVRALTEEVAIQKQYLAGESLDTIYFGGGTPSLLTVSEMRDIMEAIHKHFPVSTDPEITLEANPDDLSSQKLKSLKSLGINRLSIGIQSFDDVILQFLNRGHNSAQALQSIPEARNAGFNNISMDLIYAIPGQNEDAWQRNISLALALSPEHLSAYALTVEPRTAFGKWQASGKFQATDEDMAAEQLELLMDMSTGAGYEHYEISNFSKPDLNSRHNSSYWQQKKYLGIGPGAHSYDGESRQANIRNNALYVKAIEQGSIPFEREVLTSENKINEYILTTLRTSRGSHLETIQLNFGVDLIAKNQAYVDTLQKKNLVVIENGFLKLTRSGKLLADKIAADLFVDER